MRNTFGVLLVLTAVFGLGLGLAFAGGAFYGRRTADAVAAPVATAAPGGGAFGGAGGAGGAGGGGQGGAAAGQGGQGGQAAGAGASASAAAGGAQARSAIGVIEKVEGNTLTLRTQAGSATVTLAPDTSVMQTAPAQAGDLKAGQTVVVAGTPEADGKIAARSVTISPQAQRP
jgi:hypothetical protein